MTAAREIPVRAHLFARRRHDAQVSPRVDEHEAAVGGAEQLDAALHQQRHEVDDIEVIDERVGQLDKGLREPLLTKHHAVLLSHR